MKTKEIKIAIIAILAVAIIYVGIIFLKGLKLFSNDVSYYVEIADVQGMPTESQVLANGLNVGQVKAIDYNARKQKLVVEISVKPEFQIPQGTTVYLSKEMLGNPKMNLKLGPDQTKIIHPGDTIQGEPSADLMTQAASMLPQIEALIPKIDSILSAFNNLANDPALAASLHNMEGMTAQLKTTTSQINSIMGNDVPKLLTHANNIGDNLEKTTETLNNIDIAGITDKASNTLGTVQELTNKLYSTMNSKDNSLGMLMNDNSIALMLDSTFANSSKLLEDLRLHPKRYVHFSLFGRKQQ